MKMTKLIVVDIEADDNVVMFNRDIFKTNDINDALEDFFEMLKVDIDHQVIDDIARRLAKYNYVRWHENFCFSIV